MRELDFGPGDIARSLQKRKSCYIEVVVTQVDHFYFSRLLQSVEGICAEKGYKLLFGNMAVPIRYSRKKTKPVPL
jgi:LacI family sucrose operon transcriptional repressor